MKEKDEIYKKEEKIEKIEEIEDLEDLEEKEEIGNNKIINKNEKKEEEDEEMEIDEATLNNELNLLTGNPKEGNILIIY